MWLKVILQIIFLIFVAISVINVIHFAMYIVGANFYDIKKFKNQSKIKKNRSKIRPKITILIPAHNEEKSIIRCLESIRKNSYRKFQVIVIDDKSSDNTRKLVAEYIKKNSKRNVKLMYKQNNVGKAMALNHALRTGVEGSLVMTLDADTVLHKNAISCAVKYFEDPEIVGVAANVRIIDDLSILGLLQKFEYIVGYRSKKFYSLTNCEFIVGGVASTYRLNVMKNVSFYDNDTQTEDIGLSMKIVAQGNKKSRIIYGSDVLAMTESVATFKALLRQRYRWKMGCLQNLFKYKNLFANSNKNYSRSLTFYRIPMAFFGEIMLLLEPFAIAFVIYLTIASGNPSFIIGAYMAITGYLLLNVWPDEHMSIERKLKMSFYSPVMYFLFYIMNLVQLIAITRCIFKYKQIFGGDLVGSTWVSPERNGNVQVQFN